MVWWSLVISELHQGLAFPKTSVTWSFGHICWAQTPRAPLINDSDTAQGPTCGLDNSCSTSQKLSKSRLCRDNSSEDIYRLTWKLSQFGNSASNNSPKVNALWRNWGLVTGNKTPIFWAVSPGWGRSFQHSKYLLRLLFLLTQISNSLNYIFDFQIWQYQVSKSQS